MGFAHVLNGRGEMTTQDPSDMGLGKTFQLLTSPAPSSCAARLGRLALPGRRAIETPNYTAVASRGAVPHLTPDNLSKHTAVGAVYLALEDFVEKKQPPIYRAPEGDHGRLHGFSALPPDRTTILAPRRCPPIKTPMGNGDTTVSLLTSTGFAKMKIPQFASAVETLRPDVAVAPSDSLHTSATPASKKLVKMVERTETWLDEFLQHIGGRERLDELGVCLFAPVLAVEHPMQWDYLRHLAEDVTDALSGLAIYDVSLLPELIGYGALTELPKLSLDAPRTPHEVLRQVALGVDVCTIPFVNSASDSGVALTFLFPPPVPTETLVLGVDMWTPEHCTSLTPLLAGCTCYACTEHHRAYVHHLLNAKEMLGWVLLQIHNQHIMSVFFEGVRRSLARGGDAFEQDRKQFCAIYEPEIPEGPGEKPRIRGYQYKSEAGQEKKNKASWVAELPKLPKSGDGGGVESG